MERRAWTVNNPIAARCALLDFYWLAKILRADVSQQGDVRYQDHSWLSLIATRRAIEPNISDDIRARARAEILRQEEVLRSVFGYACDLIQNAVQIADECEEWFAHPEDYAFPPAAIERSRRPGWFVASGGLARGGGSRAS